MYDIQTGQSQQVAGHDAPIKCCEYIDMNGGMLVTAGWDKKLKVGMQRLGILDEADDEQYWDLRAQTPVGTVELSDRAYSMDTAQKLLVRVLGLVRVELIDELVLAGCRDRR